MTSPHDAIRARRRLTNKFIAAHDAARLKPFFAPDAKVISGDGGLMVGAEQIVSAFTAQFAEPSFINYVRATDRVEIDGAGERAAEHGHWAATWKDAVMSGDYLAVWRKVTGQWVIESETFVTLKDAS